jgi:hypothetical protein
LNAMDQLWKELKRLIAANRQATSIDTLAGLYPFKTEVAI